MSDALTDISRSERISEYCRELIKAEKDFFINPSDENLKSIYCTCDALLGCHGGYWGENVGFANKIKEHYEKRFDGKEGYIINSEDIAYFLNWINKDYRLIELTDLLTRAQPRVSNNNYYDDLNENLEYVYNNVSVKAHERIKNNITGKELGDILKESKILKMLPTNYKKWFDF